MKRSIEEGNRELKMSIERMKWIGTGCLDVIIAGSEDK